MKYEYLTFYQTQKKPLKSIKGFLEQITIKIKNYFLEDLFFVHDFGYCSVHPDQTY
jgi:hypothetical protein